MIQNILITTTTILLLLLLTINSNIPNVTASIIIPTTAVTVYATNCYKNHHEVSCTFNSTRLNLGTATTIQIMNYNGQYVKCYKKQLQRSNVWYGTCNGNARDANFVRRKDKTGIKRIFGSIIIGNDICQLGPNAYGIDTISCTPISDYEQEELPTDAPDIDDDDDEYHERTRNLHFGFNANAVDIDSTKQTTKVNNIRGRQNMVHQRNLYDDSGTNIDVMVVWTRQAECKVSKLTYPCTLTTITENNIRGLIDLAIQETNTAFILSGIQSSIRLVHAYRDLTYVESTTYATALYDVRNITMNGKFDDVHAKRALYGADMVQLFVANGSKCGQAYYNSNKESAFAVISTNCATGYYSYAHEIGHNLGMNHDRGSTKNCGYNGYNYGYRSPNATFRSIMAYNCVTGECDNMPKNGCIRVQRFSNTQFPYNGEPMGSPGHDNARQMNTKRQIVASFYPAMNCYSNSQCNDNNANTIDTCNIANAACIFTPIIQVSPTTTTKIPIKPPSQAPRKPPTNVPIKPPTNAPIKPPTKAPTTAPTNAPVRPPTKAPTRNPTKVPIKPPTKSPTRAPVVTRTPTTRPSRIPTKSPIVTRTPTQRPSRAPTKAPVAVQSPVAVNAPVPTNNNTLPLSTTSYYMESMVVQAVTSTVWRMVLLNRRYVSPIPVCTVQYDMGTSLLPAIARIQFVSPQSFEVRLQNPSDQDIIAGRDVHCIVVEEGAYKLPDGRNIEARKYISSVTDHDQGWNGQAQTYMNRYTNPIVLGQVMTYADLRWSVFYSRASTSRDIPPNAQSLRVGKHVGEDTPITRIPETVGYIVIEKGHASYSGIEMESGRTSNSVVGYVETKNGYLFSTPFQQKPTVTVCTQAGMNNNEGSWAVLTGNTSNSSIGIAVDEDQKMDVERIHPPEEVDYIVFGTAGVIQLMK